MLELSLQPTKLVRGNGQTVHTWDYKRLLFERPIALDVLGIAPIDRLGELTWLGPASVVVFRLLLGLVAHALRFKITTDGYCFRFWAHSRAEYCPDWSDLEMVGAVRFELTTF